METKREILAQCVMVSKCYNQDNSAPIVKDINLTIHSGEVVLFLGPSGSGKTTLLTLLGAIQQPTAGEVFLFGKRTQDYSLGEIQKLRAEKIGFVFQNFKLLNSLTILENLTLIQQFAGVGKEQAKGKALEALQNLELISKRNEKPRRLSQGEQQRVAVARSMMNDTRLIIADEPTGSLNTEMALKIAQILSDASKMYSKGVVIATHDERLIKFADRIYHLKDGKICS